MELNSFTTFLTNPLLRWLFWLAVAVLNFYAFIHDPLRFSSENIIGIPAKWFIYGARMLTFTLDVLTFLGLWFTIPFVADMPVYWFIPFVILGYALISQYTSDGKIYTREEDTFAPPPTYLWSKRTRIILFIVVLLLNIMIFLQFYVASGIKAYYDNTVLHHFFLQRFGGFYKGNHLAFIVAWLAILALYFDAKMLKIQYNFTACQYDLPDSWNF
jgi:hypothetical protein